MKHYGGFATVTHPQAAGPPARLGVADSAAA
jgi:hypothetical protein